MLADMSKCGAMNDEDTKFFSIHVPARSAFGTSGLALGARVEIEGIAVVSPARALALLRFA
jgi:2-iminobutanoate/2-iminopropanoate deaminase